MDFFQKLFQDKDKKRLYSLVFLFAAGVLLLVLSSGLLKGNGGGQAGDGSAALEEKTQEEAVRNAPETYASYETDLEARLEKILSLVEGAGKVEAMITLSHGKETVVLQDTTISETHGDESDGQGGTRVTSDYSESKDTVMVRQSDGSEMPVVLVEAWPKVEGVIIIAEGGNNIIVKDALIKAAQAVLGVEVHKVQVFKMKQ